MRPIGSYSTLEMFKYVITYTCYKVKQMSQMCLYIDDDVYVNVKSAAKKRDQSVSSYVNDILKEHLEDEWPEEFFDCLGSIDDETFKEPEDLPWSPDSMKRVFS